jgi:transcription termination factor NusB
MCILLREIKEDVMDKDEQSQLLQSHHPGDEIRYRGKKHGRLANILQQLLNSLRIDLQSYREMFPADDVDKLEELSFAIKLVYLIVECQHEALGEREDNPSKIVEDSMRQCSKATFDSLMQEWLAATAEKYPAGSDKTASPLEFFLGLMQLLVAAILEDRNSYEPCVSKYCKFSLEELTAQELWDILGERLYEMLQKQKEDDTFPVAEYINLLLALNQMYKDYILPRGQPVPSDIEFPSWFDFYILKYLDSFEEDSLRVTSKAVASDRNGKFARLEGKPLSSSVYDIFWWLHEGNKVFDKLSCGNMAVHHLYYKRFAEIIRTVIDRYVKLIGECMDEFLMDLSLVLMLVNDIQQSRVNLQNIYEAMGSRMRAGDECSHVLTELQAMLSTELTLQCTKVAQSLHPAILQGVKTIKTEIMRIKGVVKTSITSKDVTPIVSHLMNTLASKGSQMKSVCEESVLKKLVKELWVVTMSAFHEVLLPGSEETQASSNEHNFSQRQCLYLEHVLNIVKDFFLSLKEVHLKTKVLEQSLAPIRKILGMYQKSTNVLISQFTEQEAEQDAGQGEDTCGEISLQVESYIHPGSQELEVAVQVMSLSGLKPLSPGGTIQKPFVELYLLGPNIHGITRRYRTGPAKGQDSFTFANEIKRMTIPQSVNFEHCELQVLVKTQGFFAGGHLLGVTILQLKNHIGENSVLHLSLVSKLKISREGLTIMSVLAQRTGDELAKEFVTVKREERVEKKGTLTKMDSIDQS